MWYFIQVTIIRWRKLPLFSGVGKSHGKKVHTEHEIQPPLKMYAWCENTNFNNKTLILSFIRFGCLKPFSPLQKNQVNELKINIFSYRNISFILSGKSAYLHYKHTLALIFKPTVRQSVMHLIICRQSRMDSVNKVF